MTPIASDIQPTAGSLPSECLLCRCVKTPGLRKPIRLLKLTQGFGRKPPRDTVWRASFEPKAIQNHLGVLQA